MILRPVMQSFGDTHTMSPYGGKPWDSSGTAAENVEINALVDPPALHVRIEGFDGDLCLHCQAHNAEHPRRARARWGWCRKCRDAHRDRRRWFNGHTCCRVCATPATRAACEAGR